MHYHVLTLFPEMIEQGLNTSILGKAIDRDLITLEAINIRNKDSLISTSDAIEANFDASAPVIKNYYINNEIQQIADSYSAEIGNTLKITIEDLDYSSEVFYEWVRTENETETHVGTGSELMPTEEGRYKCIVKNTYKGRDKVTSSKVFKV